MSIVDIVEVRYVSENPCPFSEAFQFEITFECLERLDDDLEWSVTYVGSAEDPTKDQVLEEVAVGPVPLGTSKFVLEAPAPRFGAIPVADRLGVTVASLACAYLGQTFVSVGYYVNNEYYATDAEPRDGGVPIAPDAIAGSVSIDHIFRNVCSDQPRVTRYAIKWQASGSAPPLVVAIATAALAEAAAVVDDDAAEEEEHEDQEDEDLEDEDQEDEDQEDEVDLEAVEEEEEEGGEGSDDAADIVDDSELVPTGADYTMNEHDTPAPKKLKPGA